MGLINWDLIPGFLMPLLVKEIIVHKHANDFPTDIYLLKVNRENNSTRCKICLKLTKTRVEQPHWRRSGIFIVNLKIFHTCISVSAVYFEQVNVVWFVI